MIESPTPPLPRVLVVQPEKEDPLDRMELPLVRAGLELHVVHPYAGEPLPDEPFDGVIVLGGAMSAWDDAEHPWLIDVRSVLRSAVRESRPTLGICLGAQLLAEACGGRVVRGERGVEAGIAQIQVRSESASDPLLAGMPEAFAATELHFDAIADLPPDAAWLGESTQYAHQAFRVGEFAWGVQFHPEVSREGYASWLPGFDDRDAETVDRVRSGLLQIDAHEPELADLAAALSARFARVVHGGHGR